MNRKKVRKAGQALSAAREVYKKAAEDFLAAVEATPAEIEAANEIIYKDDLDAITMGLFLPCEFLSHDEAVADAILEDLRGEQLQ